MALQSDLFEVTKKLKVETASTNISLGRIVETLPDGGITTVFPVNIFYNDIVYELDDAGNKIAINEKKNNGAYQLTGMQAYGLFTTQVTLENGKTTVLGELIAELTDQILRDHKLETLIIFSPSDITCAPDETVKFTVQHQDAPIQYQWKVDGQSIPGETGSSLTIAHATSELSGKYYSVVLTTSYGSVESTPALLTVV